MKFHLIGVNHNTAPLDVRELHEVRKVNRALEELKKYALKASDLVPAARVAGREPPPRLILERLQGEPER